MKKDEESKPNVYLPLLLALVLIIGMFIGSKLKRSNDLSGGGHFFSSPDKLETLLNIIESDYVDSVSKSAIIEKAIPVVLENLDPHSVYLPPEEAQSLNEPLEGNFEGIGIEFNIQEDTILVVNTINGGPSQKIGLLPGDRIVKVDDTIVAGIKITNQMVMKKLKGKGGTTVKVEIYRRSAKEKLTFEIVRGVIPIYSVDVEYEIKKDIGYIKINQFARTTYQEFEQAVDKLIEAGMTKLILDLRGNGGGYLDAATEIADEFLPAGKLIVYTQGKKRPRTDYLATKKGKCEETELVVLIDSWSASASEIVAGAIQDNDRGTIIGQRSFGKGLVQEPTDFSDGSSLRLTVARYYTPTGRCIQKSYKNGKHKYAEDIMDRYLHHEFDDKDSTKFDDSLKFKTPKGKIVYGGGGIMPDIFVPHDTTDYSPYYSKVNNKSLIYKFAMEYTDSKRSILKEFKTYKEVENYLERQQILQQFLNYSSKNGAAPTAKDLKASSRLIETQIKAFICRNFFDNAGFYPVIHEIDPVMKKAVEFFSEQ